MCTTTISNRMTWGRTAFSVWAKRLPGSNWVVRTRVSILAGLVAVATSEVLPARAGDVLDGVRDRAFVRCSIDNTPGFGAVGPDGRRAGMDVDFCRAVAAAVLGDAEAVELLRITTRHKFDALAKGEVDIVLGMTTWTLKRDTLRDANFAGVLYYDGQGFLAWRDLGATGIRSIGAVKVCAQAGTTGEANLRDFAEANKLPLTPLLFASSDERREAFLRRRCEVTTNDLSALAGFRAVTAPVPANLHLFPETISREPLGPLTANRDDAWHDIVKWTLNALILAEAKGVSSANATDRRSGPDPEVRRLLGSDGDLGPALGLPDDWAFKAIVQVGNYGEIYDRHLGPDTALSIPRGLNALWTDGGLLYPPAFR